MSTYTDCGEAARKLLDDPTQRIYSKEAPEGIFTELDVIFLAARDSEIDYDKDQMRLAQREASQVMGSLFRSRHVVRFGPVSIPGGEEDYVRIDAKIAYAGPDGPKEIKTPNGTFKAILVQDDPIVRRGRRLGTNRTDLVAWDNQQILEGPPASRETSAEQREIMRLEAERNRLRDRLTDTESALARAQQELVAVQQELVAMRERSQGDQADDDILDLIVTLQRMSPRERADVLSSVTHDEPVPQVATARRARA